MSVEAIQPKAARYPIESVANAGRLLGLFKERRELRLSDVAEALAVSPSTAHRLLTTLEVSHMVVQNSNTRCYEPGPELMAIAHSLLPTETRWSFARPYLERLSERVGETVSLAILQGPVVVFVESIESAAAVRVGSRLGAVMPAHCTSVGKLLLAQLPEDKLLETYPSEELVQANAKSIATRDELQVHLRKTAKRGYATNFGEGEPGISGVAVLVESKSRPSYALAVAAPSERLAQGRVKELVSELQATASALSDLS
ncbi:IclR family transcriptional regulator [Arthrobacter sp. 31Y]|uniref:IclR family transcriptional regulator n=1 Tax=Arthrobacter sp. 31Y TaxID=1115632 RepID=UPI0004664137|nr:IclR family transcriptional regulator [Arthrobacter sp. 31Y]